MFLRALGVTTLMAALPSPPALAEMLHGTALLRERIALPEGLTFEATISDVSRADAPAEVLADVTFQTSGQPPFAFKIEYDPTKLQPQARYALRATLKRNGVLVATTDTIHSVLHDGQAEAGPVEVILRLVGSGGDVPDAELTNTYWRIESLMGAEAPRLPNVREPHLILHAAPDARYVATVGCNSLIGGYAVEGESLTFMAGASTLMACPPPLDEAERNLSAVLMAAKSHRISGNRMEIMDAERMVIATLEAVYLK